MDWSHGIALIGTAVAIVCSLAALLRNSRNDNREEAQQQGAILTELGYIKSGVDDIKAEQRDQRKFNANVTNKLATIEASAARAHARIDRLERHEDKN